MKDRLIGANALKEMMTDVLTDIKNIIGMHGTLFDSVIHTACKVIDDAPTIEAEPVKHGKWVVEHKESIRCSECCFNRANIKMPMDFCPNCGAKMDRKGD